MSTPFAEHALASSPDTLAIPGAVIPTPPPLEQRIYYVPPEVEAYTPSSKGNRRSVTDIARECLPPSGGPLFILPNHDAYTMFDLMRKWQKLGTTAISQVFETGLGGQAADSLSRQKSVEAARSGNRLSRLQPEDRLITFAKKMEAVINPEWLTRSSLHRMAGDGIMRIRHAQSETYILPKDMEASVRIMSTEAAAAWLLAFKNVEPWYEAGFNYIPVEPVQDIVPTDDPERVAALTTTLRGPSLETAMGVFSKHKDQLYDMKERIRTTLSEMCIRHGDLSVGNFVAVPYTKPSGRADLSRCPRLYVIDFEAAKIIQ